MKSKNTILVIVLLLICGVFYWFMGREGEGRHKNTGQQPFATTKLSTWQRLELSSPGKKPVTLVKKDDHWQVEGMAECKVKEEMVRQILTALKNLKLDSMVTSGKQKFTSYQVDEEKGIRVHGIAAGKPVGLVVGKVAADFLHTYVRLENDQRIFRINGLLGHLFAHDPADFCQQEDEISKGAKDGKNSHKFATDGEKTAKDDISKKSK
ncbi:MAG TPA: DUF4340 domain-containing protein [Proteobacteria bacterium]|nr:DUF4340 domain-containing protein [Pseudomonadota bacterium]